MSSGGPLYSKVAISIGTVGERLRSTSTSSAGLIAMTQGDSPFLSSPQPSTLTVQVAIGEVAAN
jgi:hypothetical protein